MLSKQEILTFFNRLKKDIIPFIKKYNEEGNQVDEWKNNGYGIDIAWVDNELSIVQEKILEMNPEYKKYKFT